MTSWKLIPISIQEKSLKSQLKTSSWTVGCMSFQTLGKHKDKHCLCISSILNLQFSYPMSYSFREELLNEVFITEYSNKELPWNSEYLKDKDGDFLFNLVKKPRRPT